MDSTYTVKEISNKLSMSIDTLRYYDKINLLSPKRGDNQYRYYDQHDILKLQYVGVMKYAGFSLEEIKVMLNLLDHEPSEQCKRTAIALLSQKQEEIKRAICNYTNLLTLLEESIVISEKIDSFPEEHQRIDGFIQKLFEDIHCNNEKEVST